MSEELFNAILSMDAYNRGYGAGIDLRIKDARQVYITDSDTIYVDSFGTHNAQIGNVLVSATRGQSDAEAVNFYAIAYKDTASDAITISYRGTDDPNPLPFMGDPWYGWGVGRGSPYGEQAEMAIKFYQAVPGMDTGWMQIYP